MAGITLHYFALNGRGETSRMILYYNGIQFEDKRYTFEEFGKAKADGVFELGKMPMLEIENKQLVESYAIEAYLCRKFGYTTSDIDEIYAVECAVSIKNDLATTFIKFAFPQPDQEGLMKWLDENLGKLLGFFEAKLTSNNNGEGFFVGNGPTHADFAIFQVFYDYFLSKPAFWEKYEATFDEKAPKLKAFLVRFPETSPTLKAYVEQKDKTLPV